MHIDISTVYDIIFILIAVVGFIYGLGRFSARVDENTKATEKLTGTMYTLAEKVTHQLNDHEVRISVLEKK